jgi:hypothetical protein
MIEFNLRGIGYEGGELIEMVQDRDQLHVL